VLLPEAIPETKIQGQGVYVASARDEELGEEREHW
jgi:hypothetical protein